MTELAGRRVFLSSDALGGVWTYSRDLAAGLAQRGAAVTLALLGPVPDDLALPPSVTVLRTGLPLDWTAADSAALTDAGNQLADIARGVAPDVTHLHAPALLADGDWRRPVAVMAHSCVGTWWRAVRGGALPADLAWRHAATGAGLLRADAVLAPSHAFAAELRCMHGEALPVRVVHNGSDPLPEAVPAERARAVLAAGRLWDEGKGMAMLDSAAALIDAPVFAAGASFGPNGANVTLRNIETLGVLEGAALRARMAATRVFASASRYEPFGLAVLEAAQAGMALVLADIASFRELWDGCAIFADPRDPAEFAAALLTALGKSDELGERARRRAWRYSISAMVDATLAAHRDLLRVTA